VDDDEDSVLSDAPEDPFEPTQPITPATAPASVSKHADILTRRNSPQQTYSASDTQLFEDLTELQDEEDEIHRSKGEIVAEIAESKLALQEINEELRKNEEKNRMFEEKLVRITARREQLLEGVSAMEAYRLGGEMMNKR
jgi:chromosome segregation ATPase